MEYILFSNQVLKHKSGEFTGSINDGERKIVFNTLSENHCSLFIYNMYDSPHSVIRGIKQAKIIINEGNYIEIQGYGLSSNGFPNDHLKAKICYEDNEIISVEYIDSDRDVSILHKKRIKKNSNFFFELFNLDVNDYDYEKLSMTLKLFNEDFEIIKDYTDEVELSVCCDFLFNLTKNQFVRSNKSLHLIVCMINYYFQYRSILLKNGYQEKQKMIELLNKNGETFIEFITILFLKNPTVELTVPFSNDTETNRAIKIFWLLESYYLFIEQENNYPERWEDVVQYNKSKFNDGLFYPYNITSSKVITKKLFDLLYDNLILFVKKKR